MRFNFTGRKKVLREHVSVSIADVSGTKRAPSVNIDLSYYDLPEKAPVFLEFYSSSSLKRAQYGTSSNPVRRLPSQFESNAPASELKVRLKVLDPDEGCHRILALMKGTRPEAEKQDESSSRDSLLALRAGDLNGRVWQLRSSSSRDEHPELVVDRTVGDYQALASSAWFQSLVMPAALEQVLTSIIVHERFADADEDNVWSAWLRFALQQSGASEVPEIDDDDESTTQQALEWIEQVVDSWAHAQMSLKSFLDFHGGVDDE